jgi:hypothetical protein
MNCACISKVLVTTSSYLVGVRNIQEQGWMILGNIAILVLGICASNARQDKRGSQFNELPYHLVPCNTTHAGRCKSLLATSRMLVRAIGSGVPRM